MQLSDICCAVHLSWFPRNPDIRHGDYPGVKQKGAGGAHACFGFIARFAELLLGVEPLWVMPALGVAFAGLLWSNEYSWVGLVVASFAFLLRRVVRGCFSLSTPFDIPIGLFLVAGVVGLFASPDWGISLGAFQSVLACILLYYTLVNISHPAYIKGGLVFAILAIAAAALLAFRGDMSTPPIAVPIGTWVQGWTQYLPQVPRLANIVTPTITSTRGLLMSVEAILILLMGIVLFAGRIWIRAVAILLSGFFLMVLLLAGSQGAWLAVAIAVLFLLICRSRWSLLPASAAVAVGYWGFKHGWFDPQHFILFHPEGSWTARVSLWHEASAVIQSHPVTGCGLGYLSHYYSSQPYLGPHNAYLQFYADVGIVGALAFLCALAVLFKVAWKVFRSSASHHWRGFAIGILAAILAISIHGLFETSPVGIVAQGVGTYYYIVSPIFWILAGVLVRTLCIIEDNP